MTLLDTYHFDIAARGAYYSMPPEERALLETTLPQAVQLIDRNDRTVAYPIMIAAEKLYVIKAGHLRLVVRKSGPEIALLDVLDKRSVEYWYGQAA